MSVAPALSTEVTYDRVPVAKVTHAAYTDLDLNEIYHVQEIADHILSNGYQVPCLQFPDDLLEDSTQIASAIERCLPQEAGLKVYILADSAYSPCCVDEIAAQHIKGDVIYHFGNACLNPVRSIPAVYIIHGHKFDLDALVARVGPFLTENAVLYADTDLTHVAQELASRTDCLFASPVQNEFIPALHQKENYVVGFLPNRQLPAEFELGDDTKIVYLAASTPSESLLLHLSTLGAELRVFDLKSADYPEVSPFQSLQKRYRLVNMAKAAGTIGILVNTLSLKHASEVLDIVKRWITAAEKKYYTFVVGKPNVPKLANFEVIDMWVVLGCSMGGVIVDSSEFYKPIITPYELQMALNDEWTGKWLLDFEQVLQLDVAVREDDDEPLFDAVTGSYVTTSRPLRQGSDLTNESGEVATTSRSLTVKNTTSTAAKFLQTRSWTGLGSDHADPEESAELKIGRSGIARNYASAR